jgi:hypothetical protein
MIIDGTMCHFIQYLSGRVSFTFLPHFLCKPSENENGNYKSNQRMTDIPGTIPHNQNVRWISKRGKHPVFSGSFYCCRRCHNCISIYKRREIFSYWKKKKQIKNHETPNWTDDANLIVIKMCSEKISNEYEWGNNMEKEIENLFCARLAFAR